MSESVALIEVELLYNLALEVRFDSDRLDDIAEGESRWKRILAVKSNC